MPTIAPPTAAPCYLLAELAEIVGGVAVGFCDEPLVAALPLAEAGPGAVTFATDAKGLAKLDTERPASVALVPVGTGPLALATVEVDDPHAAMVVAAGLFTPKVPELPTGIHPDAVVHPSVKLGLKIRVGPYAVVGPGSRLGDGCTVHPNAFVGALCDIGADAVIHPHASLYPRTVLGARSIVHSHAVLGCDGFGYQVRNGRHEKVPQQGNVVVGADVEIGAGTAVDRGTFGATRIGEGTKIDNQVMIGHNCQIGRHNIIVAHVGMAGSCTTGDHVVLAGKVGIADHVNIGAGATLAAGCCVFTDVPAGQTYLGVPGRPERDAKKQLLMIEKLPESRQRMKDLDRRVAALEAGETYAAPVRKAG